MAKEKVPKLNMERRFSLQMQQQNYYYQPAMPRYTPMQTSPTYNTPVVLRGRPVSSLEEVRAAAVDFDGVVTFFPDLANGRIYTKQCNADGTASINLYEMKQIPVAPPMDNSETYVTRKEFNEALTAIKNAFNSTTKIDSVNQTSNNNVKSSSEQQPLQEFNFN